MNKVVVIFTVVAVSYVMAVPIVSDEDRRKLPALKHEEIRDNFGQYAFRYITAEGTIVSERGYLVPNKEGDGYVLVVEGQTTYIGEDGKPITTFYKAGPNGSEIVGDHLPVPVKPEPVPAR